MLTPPGAGRQRSVRACQARILPTCTTSVAIPSKSRGSNWLRRTPSGDSFSLADACLAPYFQTLLQFDWTGLFEEDCPRVVEWFHRCRQRESYRDGVARDFPDEVMADLRAQGAKVWHKIAAHLE